MPLITFKITGTSPILMNSAKAMEQPNETTLTKSKSIPTAEEEAEMGAYRKDNGSLYFPATAFKAALVEAGKGFKLGPKTFATTTYKRAVQVTQDRCDLFHPDTGAELNTYEVDVRRCVVKSGGRPAGVRRARPLIREWVTYLEMEVDEEFFPADKVNLVTQGMERAGRIVGIGNFRPECSGPFGRFSVEVVK